MAIITFGTKSITRRILPDNLPEGPISLHTNFQMILESTDHQQNLQPPFSNDGMAATFFWGNGISTQINLDDFPTPTKMSQIRSVEIFAIFNSNFNSQHGQTNWNELLINCADSNSNYMIAPSVTARALTDPTSVPPNLTVKDSAYVNAAFNVTTSLRSLKIFYLPNGDLNILDDSSRIAVGLNINNYDVEPYFYSAHYNQAQTFG